MQHSLPKLSYQQHPCSTFPWLFPASSAPSLPPGAFLDPQQFLLTTHRLLLFPDLTQPSSDIPALMTPKSTSSSSFTIDSILSTATWITSSTCHLLGISRTCGLFRSFHFYIQILANWPFLSVLRIVVDVCCLLAWRWLDDFRPYQNSFPKYSSKCLVSQNRAVAKYCCSCKTSGVVLNFYSEYWILINSQCVTNAFSRKAKV